MPMTNSEYEEWEEDHSDVELPFEPISVLVAQVMDDYCKAKAKHEKQNQ
jgi:hypothetical protein